MDIVEVIGAIIGTIYLILEYKASPWLWLFGLLMPMFYVSIFYKNGIYANMTLNIYYIVAGIYGLWSWKVFARSRSKTGASSKSDNVPIRSLPKKAIPYIIIVTLAVTALVAWVLHVVGESKVAVLDGFTAALNVVGMWMLAKKYYQQWICWIIIEPLMVAMSLLSRMYPTAVMYLIYCVIAVLGYRKWKHDFKQSNANREI